MSETIQKLRPDRDLQVYFYRPTAIAALSNATATGFRLSGSWRQQFDWAVLEWNRDNVFEHPSLRYLPDGDLSGLSLSYEESRIGCIPIDSDLFPTVDWPYLRIWAGEDGAESLYFVSLRDNATPVEGSYQPAYAEFTLSGSPVSGSYVGIANADQHFTYQVYAGDSVGAVVQAIADSINAFSTSLRASVSSATLRVYANTGVNGNRRAVYSYVSGTTSVAWDSVGQTLRHGASPTRWRVALNFANLIDRDGHRVPTERVRKMRWTYAADLQDGDFQRTAFQVLVSNWSVTGQGRNYLLAGPGSRRIEQSDGSVVYTGSWVEERGNYSGGSIRKSVTSGSRVSVTYRCDVAHTLYLGTRCTPLATTIAYSVDGGATTSISMRFAGEDYLRRLRLLPLAAGTHHVSIQHAGTSGEELWFDFVEAVVSSSTTPVASEETRLTLATDWDTDHSIAIAAERTAWILNTLGFKGRANHYMGALWFYELVPSGFTYARVNITFGGSPAPNSSVTLQVAGASLSKLVHVGDDASTLALAFAQKINGGYTAIRAEVQGATLSIIARAAGVEGNALTISCSSSDSSTTFTSSDTHLAGGAEGTWLTDLSNGINPASRDWCRSYFQALHGYGIDCVAAFSMELGNGDSSVAAGIAQRGPGGDPILLPTPSLQTNFGPASTDFWKRVYLEVAQLQAESGLTPFLQFGEVQWWYFPSDGLGRQFSGMPFYDDWTKTQFLVRNGRTLPAIANNYVSLVTYAVEATFLSSILGEFTEAIQSWVKAQLPTCRFEVLYPTDVNRTPFAQAINFPHAAWNQGSLDVLKCESFGFTLGRNLDLAFGTIRFGETAGFPAARCSHLVGIGDATSNWKKEVGEAIGRGLESVVLFALDQYCLVGYPEAVPARRPRAQRKAR